MPPRGTKKAATKRVPTRKAAAKAGNVPRSEPLPDLEKFLVELYNWPDVTDILAAEAFKEALDQFSNVADFRVQLKESLAPCYGKRRMPRTPKKLVHRVPPQPIPQTTRVIDFELDDLNAEDVSGNSTIIAVTGMVPQTPISKLQGPSSNLRSNKKSGGKTQSPFNRLCNVNPVIASTPTPSSDRILAAGNGSRHHMVESHIITQSPMYLNARSAMTLPASASRPILRPQYAQQSKNFPVQSTPKQPVTQEENERLKELKQKMNDVDKRHAAYLREQQERVARDNEQRKRRVNQNLQAKEQELERKREEHRLQQERIRQFEEAQRSPKTPLKIATPVKFHTPGQKAVPQKRTKQEQVCVVTPKPIAKPTLIPIPKPRPVAIAQPPQPKSIEVEVTIEEVIEDVVEEAINEEEIIHREEISSNVEMIEEEDSSVADKENQQILPPMTPVVVKQIKQDESAYEMTPDKVFQPSTENDYNVNDLSSGDETDNEDNPRKKVPRWAEKSTLRTNVQNLYRFVSKDTVNSHFGVLKPPKLTILFANNNKHYDSQHNETTDWNSPIANPRSAPLTAKQRSAKH